MRAIGFFILLPSFLMCTSVRSQEIHAGINGIKASVTMNTEATSNRNVEMSEYNNRHNEMNELRRMQFDNMFIQRNAGYSFDVIGSVGNNVGFAGTHEKYALLRFTPKMNISPLPGIRIYAHHDLLRVIPMDDINANAFPVLLQGLLFAAADNAVGLIATEVTWVSELLIFSLKNIALQTLVRPAVKRKNKEYINWIQDESFYCSFSFRF